MNNHKFNHAIAIHNHLQEKFAKLLALSFSASSYSDLTFGDHIKKARLKEGLRQVDVARVIGADEMTVVQSKRI